MDQKETTAARTISPRLLYTTLITVLLPFIYGIELLSIQALPTEISANFKKLSSRFDSNSFCIVFFAAFLSNIVVYNIRVDSRVTLSLSALSFSFSALFCYCTEYLYLFYLGRFLIGFAAGIIASTMPCYLSLISPINVRGMFSSLYGIGLVGGLLFINATFSFFTEHYHSIMLGIAGVFFVFPVLLSFSVPFNNSSLKDGKSSLLSLLVNPKALKSLIFSAFFHIVQNLCGINQLSLNARSIYGENFQYHVVLSLLIGLPVTILSGYLLEHFGRKSLILTSSSITSICCVAFYLHFQVFYASYLFSFGFNIGLSGIPYVILSEVFPQEYVAPGAIFATSCNWISAMISMFIPQGSVEDQYNPVFIGYFFVTLAFILFVSFYFKETKNRIPAFQ
ncbi:uncharacterized protein VICG_01917 [Vittaforma corneae ATCC 50505]|uniref:Major facilitator superfamily (MFS) profile domain-containing protein n=1 Tax=Vittaforma corneae (strain ATCC 50505) TaxID=993615 RepID=L2GKK3_VITCO|nr:uncharacterized protein VICG_01917 [Vittaforma corneae ATCC 50505]ELA41035.1 hypothetical protein VICG_01917 [Vittaforma corneae ATCC 50505]